MKVVLLLCLALPLLIACKGQPQKATQLGSPKDSAALPLSVSISSGTNIKAIHIKNLSADTLKYYIGMELWIDNEWGEAITDIHPDAPKMANLELTLPPKKDTTNQCDLTKSIPDFYKSDTARYRFKITYAKKIGDKMPYLTTEEFELNK